MKTIQNLDFHGNYLHKRDYLKFNTGSMPFHYDKFDLRKNISIITIPKIGHYCY